MSLRRLIRACGSLVVGACVMGAGLPVAASAAPLSGTFVLCTSGLPKGFDPAEYTAATDFNGSAMPLYDRLVQFKPGTFDIIGDLATSWDVSKDGLTYTFHLRHGVKWQTRPWFKPTREFNADDVVFSFDRLMHADNAFNKALGTAIYPEFAGIGFDKILDSVSKVDDYTVQFHLKTPFVPFLADLTMPFLSIFSAEYANQLVAQGKAPNFVSHPVGTGPFMMVNKVPESLVRYQANPDFWGNSEDWRAPHFKNLIYTVSKSAAVRQSKIQANECSMIDQPLLQDIERLSKDPNLKVVKQPGYNVAYIWYPATIGPFANPLVRRALDMAINREELLKAMASGYGEITSGPMPAMQWGVNTNIKPYPYDVKAAKALLAKAGYPNGFDAVFLNVTERANGMLFSTLLQGQWAKIGVHIKIETLDWGAFLRRADDPKHTSVLSFSWTGGNGDPDTWLYSLFTCHSPVNSSYWCDPKYDELVSKAQRVQDKAERIALYDQAQVIFHENLPASPLFTINSMYIMRKNVTGYVPSPVGTYYFGGVYLNNKH